MPLVDSRGKSPLGVMQWRYATCRQAMALCPLLARNVPLRHATRCQPAPPPLPSNGDSPHGSNGALQWRYDTCRQAMALCPSPTGSGTMSLADKQWRYAPCRQVVVPAQGLCSAAMPTNVPPEARNVPLRLATRCQPAPPPIPSNGASTARKQWRK